RKSLAELTLRPHLAWVFASQGANQNLSAFSIARRCRSHPPRLPAGNCRAEPASLPHLAWVFVPSGCEPKPVRFFSRKAGTSYPAMNPDAHTSDLFPDFSPVPQMVFVNDAVSLQIEADQRVILVHGVVYSH